MGRWRVGLVMLMTAVGLGTGCHEPCRDGARSYEDGQSWVCADGCNTCSCHDGETTSTLIGCAGEPGPAAGKLLCSDGNMTYRHGQTWDCVRSCGTCGCNDGDVVEACESADDADAG